MIVVPYVSYTEINHILHILNILILKYRVSHIGMILLNWLRRTLIMNLHPISWAQSDRYKKAFWYLNPKITYLVFPSIIFSSKHSTLFTNVDFKNFS